MKRLENIDWKNITKDTFGEFIRDRRDELGLSVRKMAENLGMTPVYLSDIERGNRHAPTKFLEKLAEELKISKFEEQDFYDLAAATRGFLYEDINPYLGQQPLARIALRKARDLNISDEQWIEFIEKISGEESDQDSLTEE